MKELTEEMKELTEEIKELTEEMKELTEEMKEMTGERRMMNEQFGQYSQIDVSNMSIDQPASVSFKPLILLQM